ncbi:hypothetical protein E8E14_014541 [Neopestalotiopsis sp. 37M]|nr:hypothetical protein E8E14_014541 [Neopestalotiopsis sp. 37M]
MDMLISWVERDVTGESAKYTIKVLFFLTANTIAQINKRDDYLTSPEIVLPQENDAADLNMKAVAVLSGMLLACALMVVAIFFATTRFCSAVRRQVDVVDGEFGIELNVLQPPQAQQQLESSQQSPQQSSQESHQPPSPRPSPVLDSAPRWRGIFRWPMFNRARPNTTV